MKDIKWKAILYGFLIVIGLDLLTGIFLGFFLGKEILADPKDPNVTAKNILSQYHILGYLSTAVGGFFAAKIAKVKPYLHAGLVGAIGIIFSAFSLASSFEIPSLISLVLTTPAGLLGGYVYQMTKKENE